MSAFSHISTHLMFSLKVLTISSSLCFIAMLLKLSFPHLTSFAVSDLPSILNVVASWLKPPYLYLVINCIIITIVATSKLQSKFDHYAFSPPPPQVLPVGKSDDEVAADVAFDHFSFSPPPPPPPQPQPVRVYGGGGEIVKSLDLVNTIGQVNMVATETFRSTSPLFGYGYGPEKVSDFSVYGNVESRVLESENIGVVNELENVKINGKVFESEDKVVAYKNDKGCDLEETYVKVMNLTSNKVISRAQPEAKVTEFSKPPASSRFGHKKVVKTSTPDHQGGKTLKVSKPKRHETLESTWKTITDGRPMPLTRHLRKSDTWENHPAHSTNAMDLHYSKTTKSDTFNDRTIRKKNSSMLSRSSGSGKLKKDPSLGQEELNRRVEAFITKFNEDMRLQRQESLNQYREMINRGAGP
ncbi:hypothetical protein POM88_010323 [Heracleum sosnowskyi]|uniref:DUF4408 domain-containing protein n=1 Tax=Heracleum sosnowskyi TaxID=360622 RepID=A0AAD8ISD5_9APIA|nr:hypothetical protein POM88_010323 [Heracleum sosnowskyi]